MLVMSTIALILASLISAGGSLISNAMNVANTDIQNQLDREHESSENALDRENEQLIKQMEIDQENYMASNKYQMQVEDMKAAGLNPALASGGISTGTYSTGSSAGGVSKGSGSISSSVNQLSSNAAVPLLSGIVASGIKHSTDAKYYYDKIQSETRTSAFQSLDSMRQELDF